jgi:hypothetical protein
MMLSVQVCAALLRCELTLMQMAACELTCYTLLIRLKSVRGESDQFERMLRNYLETHPAEDDRIKKLQVHVCCIALYIVY